MKSLSKYTTDIKDSNYKALVTYITAGVSSWESAIHACADSGADVLEIGLPFSDPIMDGPIIAEASYKALAEGAKTIELIDKIEKNDFSKPTVIMTYANVLYAHGVEEIVKRIEGAGISGLIIPDLTFEQSSLFSDVLENSNVSLVPLVASTTVEDRRAAILDSAEGFLYCVAIKGITGQNIDVDGDSEFISEICSASSVPTYCGVGIRTAEDAKSMSSLCDGVIVGTSLVDKLLNSDSPVDDISAMVKKFREALN